MYARWKGDLRLIEGAGKQSAHRCCITISTNHDTHESRPLDQKPLAALKVRVEISTNYTTTRKILVPGFDPGCGAFSIQTPESRVTDH